MGDGIQINRVAERFSSHTLSHSRPSGHRTSRGHDGSAREADRGHGRGRRRGRRPPSRSVAGPAVIPHGYWGFRPTSHTRPTRAAQKPRIELCRASRSLGQLGRTRASANVLSRSRDRCGGRSALRVAGPFAGEPEVACSLPSVRGFPYPRPDRPSSGGTSRQRRRRVGVRTGIPVRYRTARCAASIARALARSPPPASRWRAPSRAVEACGSGSHPPGSRSAWI